MKSESKNKIGCSVGQSLDGPPLDFSFKGIRSLEELYDNTIKQATETIETEEQSPTKEPIIKATTDKAITEQSKEHNQQKIQIIRRIEGNGHHFLQQHHKKNMNSKQKGTKKQKKVIHSQTTALFLRYNKLVSVKGFSLHIEPVFPNFGKLMWIDLSHNRLVELCDDLGSFQNLKTFYIHANYIANFKEFQKLKGAKNLRTITVHANPIEQYGEFRIIVQSILPTLKKIDSTLVTRRQAERSTILMKSMKKYPTIAKPRCPPQQSDNEDDC